MTEATWIVISLLALAVGLGVGGWAGGRGPRRELAERVRRATGEIQAQQERLVEAQRDWQARAARELDDARARWQADAEAASAAQRAELDKLTRHLTETYDELDRLRVRASRAATPQPPDTGQGFAATMPLGDL